MKESNEFDKTKLRWEKQKFIATALGGTAFFLIGLWQFNITARNDFAKPVLERQLELCIEASGAAAELANNNPSGGNSIVDSNVGKRFLSLYFGRLGVVENQCVYNAMVKFHSSVFLNVPSGEAPQRLALKIAFACRQMISRNWTPGLVALYDPQFLIDDFTDLNDYSKAISEMPGCDR